MQGPEGTVYAAGMFKLEIHIPERYPFEPPNIRFKTPVYHPNIDSGGRICLDILTMPPKGAWRPSLNISTLLSSIGLLLSEPNPDDGLMPDITDEYKHSRSTFDIKARRWIQLYAQQVESARDVPEADVGVKPCSQNVENGRAKNGAEVCIKNPTDTDHGARINLLEKGNTSISGTSFQEKEAPVSSFVNNFQLTHTGKRHSLGLKLSLEKATKCMESGKKISDITSRVVLDQTDDRKSIDLAGQNAPNSNQSGFTGSQASKASMDAAIGENLEIRKQQTSNHEKCRLPLVEPNTVALKSQPNDANCRAGPASEAVKVQKCTEIAYETPKPVDCGPYIAVPMTFANLNAPAPTTNKSENFTVRGKMKTLKLSRVKDAKEASPESISRNISIKQLVQRVDTTKDAKEASPESISHNISSKQLVQRVDTTKLPTIKEKLSNAAECVIVSDSESDEEPSSRRCRLSLTQRGLATKRRAGFR
ncbi:hypothetical protein O6H91_14G071100 [Diphasiastrum complanatum]|nr:hypothetical protein O6H91_14G071100 [Diphasiastrum complanatum]